MATLSVVIVTHGHADSIAATLEPLVAQLRDGDELIVVDNASTDDTLGVVRVMAPAATAIESGGNLGFAAGCNLGAARATGELLVLLNPDAVIGEGWRDAIEAPLEDGSGWAVWQALVTAEHGTVVNTKGGVIHFTGIAWAGGAGEPVPADPAPGEAGFASGACLAILRARYEELGRLPEEFFLYQEDVDLSLRARLAGGEVGVATGARVDHDYEFDKGPAKWRYLERNRWATVIRTYPWPLLLLLMPGLAATELALIPVSLAGGWFRQKLAAWADTIRAFPRLLGERREIQRHRVIGAGAFARSLVAELDSPYLGAAGRSGLLRGLLRGYWRVVSFLIHA
jgi:GT2 family glycosyltransferase